MSLITVQGSVDPSSIGIISPHEHIFVDIRNQYAEPEDRFRWGYDHILTHIVPMMEEEGISSKDIDIILKDNPITLLNM